jgi:hypothetical protein
LGAYIWATIWAQIRRDGPAQRLEQALADGERLHRATGSI